MTVFIRIIAGCIFVLGMSSAQAALITQSFSNSGDALRHEFDPFDTALGDLEKVSFRFSARTTVDPVDVGCEASSALCDIDANLQVIFNPGDILLFLRFHHGSNHITTGLEDLTIGLGEEWTHSSNTKDLTAYTTSPNVLSWPDAFFNGPSRGVTPFVMIDAMLTYEFSAVPAPSTHLLLLLGLLLIRKSSSVRGGAN